MGVEVPRPRGRPQKVMGESALAGQTPDSSIGAGQAREARRPTWGSSSLPTSTSRGRLLTCLFALSKHCLSGFGPCWVRAGLGVGVLEPVGELLELVGEQVPVAVQCHRRRGMAELGLDRLD